MPRIRIITTVLFLVSATVFAQERLLILSADEFVGDLWRLKHFKDATGRPATLLSLNEIRVTFPGADDAEKAKRCIEHYVRTAGVDYVMLVGDVERFPVRWRWWGLQDQEAWAVSDLYFADLYDHNTTTFNDWDGNNNGLFGEIEFTPDGNLNNDSIDFLPDVAVGRVPASTRAEVQAYVQKVIRYEIRTVPGAAWFMRAALYTGTWLDNANSELDKIGKMLSGDGFTLTKRYADWSDPAKPKAPSGVPQAVYNDLNGGVGFVSYIGHGNTSCMACLDVCSAGLTNLSNDDMLPVVFSSACDTGGLAWLARFGPYVDSAGVEHCGTSYGESLPVGAYPHTGVPRPACVQTDGVDNRIACNPGGTLSYDTDCFAESILFGNPVGTGGAIAYFGERSGGRQKSVDLNHYFFEAWSTGKMILGDMWNYSLEQYYSVHSLGQSSTWQRTKEQWEDGHTFDEPQKFVLFGDPSLHVGGAFGSGVCAGLRDGLNAPIPAHSRLRVVCDTFVLAGYRVTINAGASLLFEPGTSLSAQAGSLGLSMTGAAHASWLLSTASAANAAQGLQGVAVRGELRINSGGGIRVH